MVNWRGKPGRTVALLPHPARANPGCSWRKNWTWSGRPSRPVCEIRACSAFDKKIIHKQSPRVCPNKQILSSFTRCQNSPMCAHRGSMFTHTALHRLQTQDCSAYKDSSPPNTWLAVAFPNTGRCGINKKGVNNAPRKHSSSLQICRVSSNWETDNGNCWSWITSWVATDNRGRPIIKLPPPPSAHPLLALTTCPSFAYKVSN